MGHCGWRASVAGSRIANQEEGTTDDTDFITQEDEDNNDIIYRREGVLADGRGYVAQFWQLGLSYRITVFIPRRPGETRDDIVALVEPRVVDFCGQRYVNVEPFEEGEQAMWSYNAMVCDADQQYVSKLPIMRLADTFSIWYDDREVAFEATEVDQSAPGA